MELPWLLLHEKKYSSGQPSQNFNSKISYSNIITFGSFINVFETYNNLTPSKTALSEDVKVGWDLTKHTLLSVLLRGERERKKEVCRSN